MIRNKILAISLLAISSFMFYSCQESLDSRLLQNAQDFTKRYCPKQLDELVMLDSVVYFMPHEGIPGQYTYFHTVSGTEEEIRLLKEQENVAHDDILSKINNTQDLKTLKENGITIAYIFLSSKDGSTIFDFRYKKGEYKI